MHKLFTSVLIANRGEIAYRILQTAQRLSIKTIVVYSDADRESLAVREADEAYYLGAANVLDSYLNQDKILALAKRVGATSLHPGYGLLSENAVFAKRVQEAGITWIGPSSESMSLLASKSRAKEIAKSVNIPILPGYQGEQSLKCFLEAAERIGYPLLLKAAAGGGGRGIRLVNSANELKSQLELASTEAKNAFGDSESLLEKYVVDAYHIEVQIFADQAGRVVHLGERDCSTQRRKQKLIEEAPSSAINASLRKALTDAAVVLAKAAAYSNAGTVEFLVTPQGDFYFLEVNTRLQVEHPVTELVTGLDLVEWQFRIAAGESLPLEQTQIRTEGHAIQARIYAEDPYDQFRPQTGRVEAFVFPDFVRVDHFLTNRTDITPYYDSMLAKLICYAPTREAAIQKLSQALDNTLISGLSTNKEFLRQILQSHFFKNTKMFTRILDTEIFSRNSPSEQNQNFANALAALIFYKKTESEYSLRSWSNSLDRKALFFFGKEKIKVTVQQVESQFFLNVAEATYRFDGVQTGKEFLKFTWQEVEYKIACAVTRAKVDLLWQGQHYQIENVLESSATSNQKQDANLVIAPMAGTLLKVFARAQDAVIAGQVLAIVEAMKMQMELLAPRDGIIESVEVVAPTQVRKGQKILRLHI